MSSTQPVKPGSSARSAVGPACFIGLVVLNHLLARSDSAISERKLQLTANDLMHRSTPTNSGKLARDT